MKKILFLTLLVLFSKSALAAPIDTISKFFNAANKDNMKQVCAEFYAADAEFDDPVHKIKGLDQIIKYYEHMYENVTDIKFNFTNHVTQDDKTFADWTMHLKAKGLNGGELVKVEGVSYFVFNKEGKVTYHRDYFDLGAMVYEYIPILGRLVKYVKGRLQIH